MNGTPEGQDQSQARLLNVSEELRRFIGEDTEFANLHSANSCCDSVSNFLNARMDEVRIYWAIKSSERILSYVRAEDALGFQMNVLRREREGSISYKKQRDHTCHTVNNYLLGWYFFRNSDILQKCIFSAFSRRGIKQTSFMYMWMYVSLLHDIGYILEGAFDSDAVSPKNKSIQIGIRSLNDYFSKDFWEFYGFDGASRKLILADGLVSRRQFDRSNLINLARDLEQVGTLASVSQSVGLREIPLESGTTDFEHTSACNAFDIWAMNYRYFGNDKMSKAAFALREDFYKLAEVGFSGGNVRVLDHGVCSGLILLSFVSHFYSLHTGLSEKSNDPRWQRGGRKLVMENYWMRRRKANATGEWWWSALVWATAATAFHNRHHELKGIDKLHYQDDPITYLGILVDELQVWDRFRVFDGFMNRDRDISELPTQSSEIFLGEKEGNITMSLPHREYSKVRAALDRRLSNWSEILTLNEY